MRARKRSEPGDTPLAVILGEWWSERKLEIASMGRKACEGELAELGVLGRGEEGTRTLLWLRFRLAYEGQILFYAERGEAPPESVRAKAGALDLSGELTGEVEPGMVDIFAAARGQERDDTAMSKYLDRGLRPREQAAKDSQTDCWGDGR